jgi:hypothetical protein
MSVNHGRACVERAEELAAMRPTHRESENEPNADAAHHGVRAAMVPARKESANHQIFVFGTTGNEPQ